MLSRSKRNQIIMATCNERARYKLLIYEPVAANHNGARRTLAGSGTSNFKRTRWGRHGSCGPRRRPYVSHHSLGGKREKADVDACQQDQWNASPLAFGGSGGPIAA